jgi:hypothetical protein
MRRSNSGDPAEDPVPSYEESVLSRSSPQDRKWHDPANSSAFRPLHEYLDETRLRRIRSVLSTHFDLAILEQGASGLYKTVFVLIPSNVTSLQTLPGQKNPEVVGFPAGEVVQLIRLEGEEHSLQFWRQPAVVKELEASLKAWLASSGHNLEQTPDTSTEGANDATPFMELERRATTPAAAKKSLWQRTKEKYIYQTAEPEAVFVEQKLGWRDHEEHSRSNKVPRGQVRVTVKWKEIFLRKENEFGLFETCKGPGICATIEVGT